jgi:hypothetical protein
MDRAPRVLMPALGPTEFEFVTGPDAALERAGRFWTEAVVPSFFLSRPWFESLLSAGLDASDRAVLGVLRTGGRIVAVLPARVGAGSRHVARGDEIRSLTGPYACLFRPVFAADSDGREIARLLGRHLGSAIRRNDIVHLDAIDAAWPELDAFETGLREAGFVSARYDHFGNWSESLNGRSFEDYMTGRGGSLREIVRRRGRALEKQGVRFELHSSNDGIEAAITAYERVYSRSWKQPEPYPNFHGVLMRVAAGAGPLRLGSFWLGDRPIAMQLWILWEGTATVLKLAHDQEFDRLSPGTVLLAHMIQHVIEKNGAHEIDFGRGDDPYKQQWATVRRQRIGLIAANPRSIRGASVLARQIAGRWLQRAPLADRKVVNAC